MIISPSFFSYLRSSSFFILRSPFSILLCTSSIFECFATLVGWPLAHAHDACVRGATTKEYRELFIYSHKPRL
jgi:hypothetical protein